MNISGKQIFSPITPPPPPPGTGTVACINLDIRFACIKLSQICTVTHVLKYGLAMFVVSKKKEILKKKIGFGSDPPPLWDFVPNVSVFSK